MQPQRLLHSLICASLFRTTPLFAARQEAEQRVHAKHLQRSVLWMRQHRSHDFAACAVADAPAVSEQRYKARHLRCRIWRQ